MAICFVRSVEDFDNYLKNNRAVVANFTASWCGPCRAISPVIDKMYTVFQYVEFVRVNLDRQKALAAKYTVSSIPTFIFFKDGHEEARVQGPNTEMLMKELQLFNEISWGKDRQGNGEPKVKTRLNSHSEEIRDFIPSGFDVINTHIEFRSFEAHNVKQVYQSCTVEKPFRVDSRAVPNSSVISDSDSQMLFLVPLLNISKVYSILIKIKPLVVTDSSIIDDEEFSQIQVPRVIKIWPNLRHMISFEDAANDRNAPHSETLDCKEGTEKWIEIRLKYVKFQNVQSLCFFFDGDDEDLHTTVAKVLIIGVTGDLKKQKTLSSLGKR
ncbi:txl1 [Candida oxycetoniae]|uniref:Txl1 n=1 Tax=Candida oxycetoniae TaxID=497107 RepID=A0AAI9SY95_9ASCO|nr:txl1 [Candida oxycetoniae]KAI3405346.2 txl1 [Candida oxycetoniae]